MKFSWKANNLKGKGKEKLSYDYCSLSFQKWEKFVFKKEKND